MLTERQRTDFVERGFTHLPGAMPREAVAAMVSRFWRFLEERKGIRRGDPATWIEGTVRGIGDLNENPEFRPFGSPVIVAGINDLLGQGNWRPPTNWGQILATFPAAEWSWNSLFQDEVNVKTITWHTDYPYDTAPGELSGVQIFGLLADLDSGGGGTLVIGGSHRLAERFVRGRPSDALHKMKQVRVALIDSDPWLRSVARAVSMPRPEVWLAEQRTVLDGIPVAVAELTGKAGDAYFTHPWLLHAPSPNCNPTPRLMCTQRIRRNGNV